MADSLLLTWIRDSSRYLITGVCLVIFPLLCMGLWTGRARSPSRPSKDATLDEHYLPVSGGGRLFTMEGGPGERYRVRSLGMTCSQDELSRDSSMHCYGPESRLIEYRFTLRRSGGRLVLEQDGLRLPAATQEPLRIGMGHEADVVWPIGGIGVEQLQLLPMSDCEALLGVSGPDLDGAQPRLCVRNGGISGGLVVDRSARRRAYAAAHLDAHPQLRSALGHGQHEIVYEGDWLWAGQVPVVVLGSSATISLSIPARWETQAGDREWMNLKIPSWPLSAAQSTPQADGSTAFIYEEHRFTFWSRESLFQTSFLPLPWNTHLRDYRYAHEKEERLQSFIDHELLCYSPGDGFWWNLSTRLSCQGETRAVAPSGGALRLAEEWSHIPGVSSDLRRAEALLSDVPESIPGPDELLFVFDWEYQAPASLGAAARISELGLTPSRILGVRAGATRLSPERAEVVDATTSVAELAENESILPPFDMAQGTTAHFLEVQGGSGLAEGTLLLLSGAMSGVADASICVAGSSGPATRQGVELGRPIHNNDYHRTVPGVIPLGHLYVRGSQVFWSESAAYDGLTSGSVSCIALRRRDGQWLVDDGVAASPLSDRDELTVGGLRLQLNASDTPDRAAVTINEDGTLVRRYPFGAAMAPVLGVEGIYGGLQSTVDARAMRRAREQSAAGGAGVQLTLHGDLQRLLYDATMTAYAFAGLSQEDATIQAVLLDSTTGEVRAAINGPSFNPSDQGHIDEIRQQLRRYGSRWRPGVELQNLAFLRGEHVGSVYKLGTSYAMARAGLLEQTTSAGTTSCTRLAFYTTDDDDRLLPRALPGAEQASGSLRCSEGTLSLSGPGGEESFKLAFRRSYNEFFALAPLAAVARSGIQYAQPPSVTVDNSLSNPISGAGLWKVSGTIGATLSDRFSIDDLQDPASNAYLETMLALGHRYHYRYTDGRLLTTQWDDSIEGVRFPTADQRWMVGVQLSGFYYPSMWGPESYALRGTPGWGSRELTLETQRGSTAPVSHQGEFATSALGEYAKSAYGFGGIQASALSLAVMATPMARADRAVIAPDILKHPGSSDTGRIVTPELITPDQQALIASAMRQVVEYGGTASSYYSNTRMDLVRPAIGGKTGTFETGGGARLEDNTTDADVRAALVKYACGVGGVPYSAIRWDVVSAGLGRRSHALQERGWLMDVVQHGQSETLPRGFGASAAECDAYNPNRAAAGAMIGGVDGGVWLDGVIELWGPRWIENPRENGGAFVAVVFDGLATTPGGDALGKGLVLAVIMDGHEKGGKYAAAAILLQLQRYLALQAAVTPAPPPPPQ